MKVSVDESEKKTNDERANVAAAVHSHFFFVVIKVIGRPALGEAWRWERVQIITARLLEKPRIPPAFGGQTFPVATHDATDARPVLFAHQATLARLASVSILLP